MKQEILRIENMNVALGDVTVLTNLHLHLFSGELCCILAPSDGSKPDSPQCSVGSAGQWYRFLLRPPHCPFVSPSIFQRRNLLPVQAHAAVPCVQRAGLVFRQLLLAEGRLFPIQKPSGRLFLLYKSARSLPLSLRTGLISEPL